MASEKPRMVAVVMGGICGERDVSLSTGACVVSNLLSAGHVVTPVCIHANGSWEIGPRLTTLPLSRGREEWFHGNSTPARDATGLLVSQGVDCIFNALHGPGGEDGTIQGFLRVAGIPFTGPDVTPAALTMDKALTKAVLDQAGVRTPRGFEIPMFSDTRSEENWGSLARKMSEKIPFPWIVKPNCLGSSVGIQLLQTAEEFLSAAADSGRHWCPSPLLPGSGFIVEEQIEGRELTCGVLELCQGDLKALPPIEILPRSSEFFDYQAKYTPGATEEICPALLDADMTSSVQDLAVLVHKTFHCDPLSRTDIFLTEEGELVVLEINTLPGMTETSLIPQSALAAGIPLPDLFDQLVCHAIEREAMRKAVDTL